MWMVPPQVIAPPPDMKPARGQEGEQVTGGPEPEPPPEAEADAAVVGSGEGGAADEDDGGSSELASALRAMELSSVNLNPQNCQSYTNLQFIGVSRISNK